MRLIICHNSQSMSKFLNVNRDGPAFEAVIDLAARTAISRNYPFSPCHVKYLPKYLLRLPVNRLQQGAKLEHFMELFEHCQAKYKDPLLKKLAEADRLYFGINDRHERDEKRARKMYEELSGELFEARAMCIVIYDAELLRLQKSSNPVQDTYYQKVLDLTIEQLSDSKFTSIGLFSVEGNTQDLPANARQKVLSALQLHKQLFPIQVVHDKTEKIISCIRCETHFFEKFAFNCGFYKAPFCSPECMMVGFIRDSVNEENKKEMYFDLVDFDSLDSLARNACPGIDYLDLAHPARFMNFFKINTLLGKETRGLFKKSWEEDSLFECAYLMNMPLAEFNSNYNDSRLSIEIPILALWAQTVLFFAYAIRDSRFYGLLLLNCYFLLKSGVLKCLGGAQEKEASDHISTILYMALEASDTEVFSHFI